MAMYPYLAQPSCILVPSVLQIRCRSHCIQTQTRRQEGRAHLETMDPFLAQPSCNFVPSLLQFRKKTLNSTTLKSVNEILKSVNESVILKSVSESVILKSVSEIPRSVNESVNEILSESLNEILSESLNEILSESSNESLNEILNASPKSVSDSRIQSRIPL